MTDKVRRKKRNGGRTKRTGGEKDVRAGMKVYSPRKRKKNSKQKTGQMSKWR